MTHFNLRGFINFFVVLLRGFVNFFGFCCVGLCTWGLYVCWYLQEGVVSVVVVLVFVVFLVFVVLGVGESFCFFDEVSFSFHS